MAADERGLEHGRRKRILGELQQEAEALRALAARPGREVAAVELHDARGRRAQARERVQGERLADAVASQHRDELAALRRELEAAHERASGDGNVYRAAIEPRRLRLAQGCSRSCCQGSAWKRPSPAGAITRRQRARSCSRCSPSHQSSTAAAHRR